MVTSVSEPWHCPVCNSMHSHNKLLFRLFHEKNPLLIYKCRCGLCYSNYAVQGHPADVYDSSYYDHVRYSDNAGSMAYVQHLARFFDQVLSNSKFCTNSLRLLDVGCATGAFVDWALHNGWKAKGIDISPDAVKLGVKRGLPLHVAAIDELKKFPDAYDIITLWDVLEHLPNISETLSTLRVALKPDGILLLKTVSCQSGIDYIARAIYRLTCGKLQSPLKKMYVPGHLFYFTKNTLRRQLCQTGWKLLMEKTADTPPAALFRSPLIRVLFRFIAFLQKITGLNFELMVACQKIV